MWQDNILRQAVGGIPTHARLRNINILFPRQPDLSQRCAQKKGARSGLPQRDKTLDLTHIRNKRNTTGTTGDDAAEYLTCSTML